MLHGLSNHKSYAKCNKVYYVAFHILLKYIHSWFLLRHKTHEIEIDIIFRMLRIADYTSYIQVQQSEVSNATFKWVLRQMNHQYHIIRRVIFHKYLAFSSGWLSRKKIESVLVPVALLKVLSSSCDFLQHHHRQCYKIYMRQPLHQLHHYCCCCCIPFIIVSLSAIRCTYKSDRIGGGGCIVAGMAM